MKIYFSGLYSGTSPQPGIGIARSLRLAYPDATLIGVEYSNRSSGIHWTDFDELWLQRPWEELNLTQYAAEVKDALDAGGLWIPGVDLEAMWLADVFPDGHPNLLAPSTEALRRVAKPAITAHQGLPVRIPTFVTTDLSDWELHEFCRQHGWRAWLKGPYYEAVRVRDWTTFEYARAALSDVWSTERLFLQAHVTGYEESISFCAYQGELLGCVWMRKRELTEENKTWAGDVTEVPSTFVEPLREMVKRLNWSGGGELEMVRDAEDGMWLLECNPRFPAWIHGATIAGRNMSGLLVEGATGIAMRETPAVSEEFTRVVLEVPVRADYPLPPLPEPYTNSSGGHGQKHPSGMPALANRLHKLNPLMTADSSENAENQNSAPVVPPSFIRDLSGYDLAKTQTPSWLFLNHTATGLFERAATQAQRLTTAHTKITNAYSIKTNPDARMLELARESGFLAEAISLLEVQKALNCGFSSEQIILNGPGKWYPHGLLPKTPLHAIFADSIADLKRIIAALESGELQSKIVGVRLRTPHIPSRFGIPIDTPDALETLISLLETLPRDNTAFGIHFHMASSHIGTGEWWHLYESVLRWCASIERLTKREIECLDMGGGWFPDDWHKESDDRFAQAIKRAGEVLPAVKQIISEPGKAMAQPSMALAMRVLEVAASNAAESEINEVVLDGSIAELPMYFFQPHRILGQNARTKEWQILKRGKTRLLGRICMENDIVASNVELPEGVQVGDVLIFCDTGAYDRSMSYEFGRG